MTADSQQEGWTGHGLSHIGRVRTSNQDAFAVLDSLGLWVIADGMGGHAGGDVASRIAVEAAAASFQGTSQAESSPPYVRLRRAIQASNRAILQEAAQRPDLAGMGTTLVMLHLTSTPRPLATIAHVGDSRAYRLRAQQLTQLTVDHSLIEDYRRLWLVSEKQIKTHSLRHVLSRAVGIDPEATPDIATLDADPDDVYLLCTDGLTMMLEDAEILHLLLEAGRSRENICESLITKANQLGGKDNITVVIVSKT